MICFDFSSAFAKPGASLDLLLNPFFQAAPAHLCIYYVSEEDPHWASVPKKERQNVLLTVNIILP